MTENTFDQESENITRKSFEIDRGTFDLIIDSQRQLARIDMPGGIEAKQIIEPQIAAQVLPALVESLKEFGGWSLGSFVRLEENRIVFSVYQEQK